MTAPNIIAVMMSHTVISMLAMPPRLSRSSIARFPDSSVNPSKSAIQQPLTSASGRASSGSSTNATTVSL